MTTVQSADLAVLWHYATVAVPAALAIAWRRRPHTKTPGGERP